VTAELRPIRRQPASRPAPRTITVTIEAGDFAGWSATARADFPARLLVKLESGKLSEVLEVLGEIIVDHNMPNSDGEIAASLADVDPYAGMLAVSNAIGEALGKVPNR
jgi:hypothetical protein